MLDATGPRLFECGRTAVRCHTGRNSCGHRPSIQKPGPSACFQDRFRLVGHVFAHIGDVSASVETRFIISRKDKPVHFHGGFPIGLFDQLLDQTTEKSCVRWEADEPKVTILQAYPRAAHGCCGCGGRSAQRVGGMAGTLATGPDSRRLPSRQRKIR